jgi:pterin-4a-carbinolamine dehydratase
VSVVLTTTSCYIINVGTITTAIKLALFMSVLSSAEVERRLRTLPLWKLVDGKLVRSFEAKSFSAAMGFLVAVGTVADHSNHHPDIHLTEYRRVEVCYYLFVFKSC